MANAKLDVDIASFQASINAAKNVLKGLSAEMKAADATFKATGNAEKQLADKTKTLNSQLQVQKGIADQAKQALKAMDEAGVKPTDADYQKLYATMMNATAGMNEAQAALNGLGTSAQEAASGADQLTNSVNSIGKKISLEQVISGIDTIKSGLESAAKKAVQLGEAIWNNVMDSARLSDDILTQAGILDMTPEQYQRYKGVFNTIGEVTITEWAATKRKIEKAMVDPSSDQIDILKALGFKEVRSQGYGQFEEVLKLADNWEDVFWQVGTELQKRVESGKMSSAMADVYGEALFGKKYSSMKNLLKLGQEGFEAALNEQNIISDEALEKDAALNDAVIKLQDSFNALKAEVSSGLAPALTDAANALDGVLGKILEYLQTEEGQEMLSKLGDAVSGLFGDLSKIDPEKVVAGFVEVFTKVTGGIQWLVDNAETAKGILGAVVGAWGAITIGENVLKIMNLVNGLSGLTGAGVAEGAAAAGTAAGTSWGGAFAAAVLAAAPWLLGLLAYNIIPDENKVYKEERVQATDATKEEVENMIAWAKAQNELAKLNDELMSSGSVDESKYAEVAQRAADLTKTVQQSGLWNTYWDYLVSNDLTAGNMPTDVLEKMLKDMGEVPIETEPVVPANAAETISNDIGVVHIGFDLVPTGRIRTPAGWVSPDGEQANGIWSVPYDGYLSRLHKGERVVPAREVASRSYNSNLYVESMYMNNGTDAAGLASAMAAAQRRTMSGFGS